MIALINRTSVGAPMGSEVISVPITTPQAGSTLFLTLSSVTPTATIVSITGGGVTWARQIRSTVDVNVEMWAGPASTGVGSSLTVTVSASAVYDITYGEATGMPGIVTQDGSPGTETGSTDGSGNMFAGGPVMPTSPGAVLIIAVACNQTSMVTGGPTNSFVDFPQAGLSGQGVSAYKIIPSGSTQSTTWVASPATFFGAVTAAFDGRGQVLGGGFSAWWAQGDE